jgi:hypothetical protein
MERAKYQKNVSIILADIEAELNYAIGNYVGEETKPLLCMLEYGVISPSSLTMLMFHGDPLMKRDNDIIERVVEAGLYNYWISLLCNLEKISSQKIAPVHPLDDYYSFTLYHLQTAFYILLMGWCLSALCLIFEVLYNCVLKKIMCG